jgi:hypothetical protein
MRAIYVSVVNGGSGVERGKVDGGGYVEAVTARAATWRNCPQLTWITRRRYSRCRQQRQRRLLEGRANRSWRLCAHILSRNETVIGMESLKQKYQAMGYVYSSILRAELSFDSLTEFARQLVSFLYESRIRKCLVSVGVVSDFSSRSSNPVKTIGMEVQYFSD